MSTYGVMNTRIASDLRRSNLTDDISRAIQTAIQIYSSKRFWFNDANSLTFTTSSSQEAYAPSGISDYFIIDRVLAQNSNGGLWPIRPLDFQSFQQKRDAAGNYGDPLFGSLFGQQLWLTPVPNVSTINIQIWGTRRFTTLSASGDTNAWMTEGEVLIRTRAELDLYRYVIKDFEKAEVFERLEQVELNRLRGATNKLLSSGRVRTRKF